MRVTRRNVARLLIGAPVAAGMGALAGIQGWLGLRSATAAETIAGQTPEPSGGETDDSALGKFLAREEDDLTPAERRRVRDDVASLEKSLRAIRDYPLGNDVPPAGSFAALKSKR
jgi:hypothetical protein